MSKKLNLNISEIQSPFPSYRSSQTPTAAGKEKVNGGDQSSFENFRSFYRTQSVDRTAKKNVRTTSLLLESPRLLPPPPPENLRGSARFFVATGSSRSLIVDEAPPYSSARGGGSSTAAKEADEIGKSDSAAAEDDDGDDLIAILTYSPNPYEDFRRSMQEMVEARLEHGGEVDWEFMDELLFRYLEINNEKFCRHILRAFVDLAVVLRENSAMIPARRRPWGGGGGRRLLKGKRGD
ncbi:hypothetical protein ABFS82_04G102000 [Erythranthe guttata]|uniref:Transcription repressor n=1 Tax=Erythranthe guttata TaxID=4155 RepID=A0A022QDV2_ERYGU|nr:PREDICTED: transcription repressor OFP13-like [Erythranthe guttata]EYU24690.1 hypothetical protein MIMGU_mgv1a012903mg [Erythranthe guttata]|eukprot:XP_012852633.1 PREDICTED: transcription repressor OFP13-like [Erythranthe guttata]